MYKVVWKKEAQDSLNKIDRATIKRITDKVENFLVLDPINLGEPLKHEWKGHYRYRIGDYRVIYKIEKSEVLIIVVKVSHRKEVY